MDLLDLKGKKALVVVSSGGHLVEASLLLRKFKMSESSIFISHYNPQSLSLLKNKRHYFVPIVRSRDWMGMLRTVPKIFKISRKEEYDVIISTGAAIAISALPIRYLSRKHFFFFDSVTRIDAPSMTGKIIERFKAIEKYSEHAMNFGQKWKESPSILEEFRVKEKAMKSDALRILVTLGTISNYRFDRLIDTVLSMLGPEDEVYWQVGFTNREDLPGKTFQTIPNLEMLKIAKECDVVISHCGIGSILDMISSGIRPLVLPRDASLNEHVDNHQSEAANLFANLNLIQILSSTPKRHELNLSTSKYISSSIEHE